MKKNIVLAFDMDNTICDTNSEVLKLITEFCIKNNSVEMEYLIENKGLKKDEAIFNVLENCIKYSNKNTTITIQISKNTFFSKITITDQGIGIKKENYNNIFQRFYRAQEVQDEDGIGIGLYLTREILSREEGYITVQSEYGKGSTFTIYLKR